jgi:hypothetical protein
MYVIRSKANPLVIKAHGATMAPGGLGEFDADLFEEVEMQALPQGWQAYTPPPSAKEMIDAGRAAMLGQYKAAPIELRGLFSNTITEINGLLDLEDYELAVAKAQAVDTEVIENPEQKQVADTFKAAFVAGLMGLAQIGQ